MQHGTAVPAPADALAVAKEAAKTGHTEQVHNHRLADSYRPEVDGLRAVAVLAVLFYHAGLSFPGGFVGVDVFFVISGYLITSLVIKDMDAGRFSITTFYERRARRIVPALVALLIAVLGAGWWLLLADDLEKLGKSVVAQALFAANIYFYRAVDYFAGPAEQLPLLHTWSLAVEEQFYFVFPLLLMLCYRFKRLKSRPALVTLFGVLFAISLAVSVYGTAKAPSFTFYMLPTRAWELLAGSLLAAFPLAWNPAKPFVRELLSFVGLGGVLFAFFAYNENTPFPGLFAMPPVIGAALIIFANARTGRAEGEPGLTGVGRLLAARPVVFVGLISYSLYLWHWPLFAFSKYWAFAPLSTGYRVQLVALSFVMAILSWWLVETPFRRRKVFASKRAVLAFGGGFVVASAALGMGLVLLQGLPKRFPAEVTQIVAARTDFTRVARTDLKALTSDRLVKFGKPIESTGKIDILLWGDSHAERLLPALSAYCQENNLTGRGAINSSTAPLVGYALKTAFGLNDEAIPFGEAMVDYAEKNKVPAIMLAGFWERDLTNKWVDDPNDDTTGVGTALKRTIGRFNAVGTKVYVMLQVPSHVTDVPKALAYEAAFGPPAVGWERTVASHAKANAKMYEYARELSSDSCVFVDPAPFFADPTGGHYVASIDGRALYSDKHHLTSFGAKRVLLPMLEKARPLGKADATLSGLRESRLN